MVCPRCQEPLGRYKSHAGFVWQCARCGGRAVALSVLRKAVTEDIVRVLWTTATQARIPVALRCPSCGKRMSGVPLHLGIPVKVDVCELCQFVWTDAGELEQMPAAPPPPREPDLPPEAKEALALAKVEALKRRDASQSGEEPDDWVRIGLALLGLPVEEENWLQRTPYMTWLTAFTIAAISLLAFIDLDRAVNGLAFVPSEWWRYGGITILTSFFVHASIFHLLSNLYFLVVFGDNVEDHIGHGRFILLLLIATVAGAGLHALFDPHRDVPCIGASGGISGVIVFYALAFPHARVYVALFRWLLIPWMVSLPVWVMMLLWLVLQILGVFGQVMGLTGVSALAHLGGALAGFGCWLWWRQSALPGSRISNLNGG